MTPEFSRPVRIDTLGAGPRDVDVEADEAERGALARRFDLLAVERISTRASVTRNGEIVVAAGRLSAQVVQSCVATGEPVPAKVEEAFRVEFRPVPKATTPEEEVELGEHELDVIFYEGSSVDLGEAAAETLSLSLNPYPRSPAAEAALREAGVKTEEEAKAESSPFAGLAALKDKFGK